MKTPKELFKYFTGSWSIKKSLPENYAAIGKATFVKTSETLLDYEEQVKVNRPGFEGGAYKKYKCELSGNNLYKKFDDDKLFYELKLGEKTATGDHLCNRDTYHALYYFIDANHFTLKYDVKGPEKDYDIITEFTRICDEDTNISGVASAQGESHE